MKSVCRCVLVGLALVMVAPLFAGEDEATRKEAKRLVEEIALVPSLYVKGDEAAQIKALPKFSAKKLMEYAPDKDDQASKQRERYKANREGYAKEQPLRAAIFEAAESIDAVNRKEFILALTAKDNTPKGKAALLQRQGYLGQTIFKLEQVQARLADVKPEDEKSKHWLANYDFARARFDMNLVYLYELNYTLGIVRADALPELGAGDIGWQIVASPKLNVTESRAKALTRDVGRRLKKMQEDHAETPWAFFAERESQREVGLQWATRKK